jgi:YD repeat-containing protein
VSTTTVKLESGRSVSEAVHLEDAQGKLTVLDQHATLTMPGEGPTQGFSTRDDAKNLFCYKNLWILTEGDVKFVSNKQGPDKFRIPSAGRVSCFSPDKPHNVLFSKTERDSVVYTYERDKLAKLSDDKGNSIRLTHDAQGRCTKLSGSDGKEINYSYDNNGNLIAASDGKENSITYRNNPATGEPEAMRAGFDNLPATARRRNVPEQPGKTEITRTASTTPQEPAIPPMARSETRPAISQTVRPGRGRVTAVNIEQTQEGFLLMNGKREPDNEQLLILSRMVNRNKDEQSIDKFRRKFDAQPGDEVILTAPADVVDLIALAGKRAGLQINVATDLSTAQKNKASQLHVKTSPWTLVFKDTVSKSFYEKYEHLEKNGGSPDNLVIAVGDNNVDYQAHLMKAAEKGFFQDKVVFLAACGKPGMVKWVEEFVKTSGARGVFRFAEQQGQKELPEFVDEFRKQYKNLHDAHPESPTSPADPIQMFFRALEETIKALPKRPEMQDVNPEVIEKFRLILHQLSKLRSLEPSRFIAAAPPGFIDLTRDAIKNENKQPLAVILHHYA